MWRLTQPHRPILAGFSQRESYFLEDVVCHQEHEINVAISGSGLYRFDDGQTLTLSAGEILLLPAGVRHGIEVEKHLRMAVIHFHPVAVQTKAISTYPSRQLATDLKRWAKQVPFRKVIAPNAQVALERLTEDAMVEQHQHHYGGEIFLRTLAIQAAVHFLRLMDVAETQDSSDHTTRQILQMRSWMDRHFADAIDLADLSRQAHLAPTYFAARFSAIVGTPPMTYIRKRRIEQARLLLQRTSQPVKVIAWSVGYADVSHFNHVFKQSVGVTPATYRQREQTDPKR